MNSHRVPRWFAAIFALLTLAAARPDPGAASRPRPPVPPTAGAVASAAPDATAAGIEILAAGGNAVDAAVATALALAVVHPAAGNLGGGGLAVVRSAGENVALDFRETAPAGATRTMFLDAHGTPRPGASLIGPLAAGTPGSPAGYFELHRRFGRLPWARVVAPALGLARNGFVVTPRLHAELDDAQALLARFPVTARVWLPGGAPPAEGARMRLPQLARLLAAYAQHGPAAISTGSAARAIERTVKAHGGIMTVSDLRAYRPVWREPVGFSAFGWQFASMPLPSSGGIILAQTLGILQRRGWATLPPGSADRIHLLAETWRRAFADRTLLGDPAATLAGATELLAPAWLDARAAAIDMEHATPSTQVQAWQAGPRAEHPETTHLSVVDGDGNAVALTTTLNGAFGCGLLVPELGILLNNEMDDFTTAPGQANLYGLIQGEANEVAPGKRMLSSMTPTVAWRGGEVLAVGAPGGSRIPTSTAQVVLALVVDHADPAAAVARPRVHHQWQPDRIEAEDGALSPEVRLELERRGHTIGRRSRIGEVCLAIRRANGTLDAAADSRGPGAAGTSPATLPDKPPLILRHPGAVGTPGR